MSNLRFYAPLSVLALMLLATKIYGASCCGGGNASALVLPKATVAMIDSSLDLENYDGFWDQQGDYKNDPAGSELMQFRLNLGGAYRLSPNWQVSAVIPVVANNNDYPGIKANNIGVGDSVVSFWYEVFDEITCVWQVNEWQDLKPSIYVGGSLTLPTGESAYSHGIDNSFEITGRGFYRADANVIVEKTIYPWTVTANFSYGTTFERPINQEFGHAVEPYHKKLGDRRSASALIGYTFFFDDMDALTVSVGLSDLKENKASIDGQKDPLSAIKKRAMSISSAYQTPAKEWVFKFSYSHAPASDDWGMGFPVTDIITMGVSHVFR